MAKWIYLGDDRNQCSKCMFIVNHAKEPKRCPHCDEKMMNAFGRLFPPNNIMLKKSERGYA